MKTLIIFLFLASPSFAHSWYPAECCSSKDCKAVSHEEILEDVNDYVYLAEGIHFPKSLERPSQDQYFHVCYNVITLKPLCIFTVKGY